MPKHTGKKSAVVAPTVATTESVETTSVNLKPAKKTGKKTAPKTESVVETTKTVEESKPVAKKTKAKAKSTTEVPTTTDATATTTETPVAKKTPRVKKEKVPKEKVTKEKVSKEKEPKEKKVKKVYADGKRKYVIDYKGERLPSSIKNQRPKQAASKAVKSIDKYCKKLNNTGMPLDTDFEFNLTEIAPRAVEVKTHKYIGRKILIDRKVKENTKPPTNVKFNPVYSKKFNELAGKPIPVYETETVDGKTTYKMDSTGNYVVAKDEKGMDKYWQPITYDELNDHVTFTYFWPKDAKTYQPVAQKDASGNLLKDKSGNVIYYKKVEYKYKHIANKKKADKVEKVEKSDTTSGLVSVTA